MNLLSSDVLLTPNRRLAVTLLKAHQQKENKLSWLTPQIMPLTSWLENLWLKYSRFETHDTPLLLTAAQEQTLWEEIISQSPESDALLQLSDTAKLVSSAWELLKQWKIDISHPDISATEEGCFFQKWAKQFQSICLKKSWIDSSSLPDRLIELMGTNKINKPDRILLAGFIEISPQMQHFLTVCQSNGIKVEHINPSQQTGTAHQIALANKEDEITTMARWAKSLLSSHSLSSLPSRDLPLASPSDLSLASSRDLIAGSSTTSTKIACIIPDLEDSRNSIQRIFDQVFLQEKSQQLFNISAGKKLASHPMVHTAIQLLLFLTSGALPIEKWSHLLRSPFLGDAERENNKRALYDNYLRNQSITYLSWDALISENDPLHFSSHCPLLAKRLKTFQLSLVSEQLPDQWAYYFNQFLSTLGWPGERSLNSEEYQLIQNGWLPLLSEFSKLDHVLGKINSSKALHYLVQLANQSIFQIQTPEAPIQILGMLEAAGLSFDAIWIMGLDDTRWPKSPSPNPFIPLHLQKKLNMPNASADRELTYSKKLTEQFISSCQHGMLSHSIQDDQSSLRPSALIKYLPKINKSELMLADFTPTIHHVFNSRDIESIEDAIAPPVNDTEMTHGGTNLFKFQAACPFKAFAELRLNARNIDEPKSGLRPQDRGKIIHKTLELIWSEIKDSHTLKSLWTECDSRLCEEDSNKAIERFRLCEERSDEATQVNTLDASFRWHDRSRLCEERSDEATQENTGLPRLPSGPSQKQEPYELTQLVSKCIEKTFSLLKITQKHEKKPRYLAIEKQRLKKMLLKWLAHEKSRPDFRVIACEQEKESVIGGLKIKMRVDRIDELAQGRQLIIDYKTGKSNSIENWFGDRMDEPQLPLYCISSSAPGLDPGLIAGSTPSSRGLTAGSSIAGIAFAEIHPESITFKGVCSHSTDIPGLKPITDIKSIEKITWSEQINQWNKYLTQLATNFYQGFAEVDPKYKEKTCRECHLHSLCRIYDT